MEITELSPGDEAGCIDAAAVQSAAFAQDCPELVRPTPRGFANLLRYGWDLEPQRGFLARNADGTAVAVATVSLPTYDNTNQVWFELTVHPDHRDGVVEAELIEYVEQLARDEGRTMMGFGEFR